MLGSLADADLLEAQQLLSEHVPGCLVCRGTLAGFQSLTADLAFAAGSVAPPETLLPRLHAEIEPAERRRGPVQLFAVAASVVAVVGLAGFAVSQGARASHSRARMSDIAEALDAASRPGASITPVGPTREIAAPGSEVIYLYGAGVPIPPPGREYRIWLVAPDGRATFLGDLAIDDGVAFARLSIDASFVAKILITVEPAGSAPTRPGQVAWRAAA